MAAIRSEFADRARGWLTATYGDGVVLADTEPIRTTERSVLFGCRYAQASEPMLTATICVPADGREPFPVANAAPLDEDQNLLSAGVADTWRWRVNARNCVVAADAAVDGLAVSARPWQPTDESPGWWMRLLTEYFPSSEVATCASWSQVGDAIAEGGPGTRGVVWLRRHLDGRDLTGHLYYSQYDPSFDAAAVLDPQLGKLATVDDREVAELVLARFHRPAGPPGPLLTAKWEAPADGFAAAVAKAEDWLDFVYQGKVRLVGPDAADETRRGWLFACAPARYVETGDWRDQMLDAALVVPKAGGESPFGLPNRDPWTWLLAWDAGRTGLPEPPPPGDISWYGAVGARVGGLHGDRAHPDWGGAIEEVNALPVGSPALLWVRRRDGRDRETVGHLLWARNGGDVIEVFDPTAIGQTLPVDTKVFEVRVLRVEDSSTVSPAG